MSWLHCTPTTWIVVMVTLYTHNMDCWRTWISSVHDCHSQYCASRRVVLQIDPLRLTPWSLFSGPPNQCTWFFTRSLLQEGCSEMLHYLFAQMIYCRTKIGSERKRRGRKENGQAEEKKVEKAGIDPAAAAGGWQAASWLAWALPPQGWSCFLRFLPSLPSIFFLVFIHSDSVKKAAGSLFVLLCWRQRKRHKVWINKFLVVHTCTKFNET